MGGKWGVGNLSIFKKRERIQQSTKTSINLWPLKGKKAKAINFAFSHSPGTIHTKWGHSGAGGGKKGNLWEGHSFIAIGQTPRKDNLD